MRDTHCNPQVARSTQDCTLAHFPIGPPGKGAGISRTRTIRKEVPFRTSTPLKRTISSRSIQIELNKTRTRLQSHPFQNELPEEFEAKIEENYQHPLWVLKRLIGRRRN